MQPTLFSAQQWTVSSLTFYIRKLLEENEVLQDVWVQGKSQFIVPASVMCISP
jgi:exonuclease VII large subunit